MRLAPLLLMLVACTQPPASQFEIVRPLMLDRCVPSFSASSVSSVEVLRVDQPVVLQYSVLAVLECEWARRQAESISVELSDDSGGPLEVAVAKLPDGPNRFAVRLSFTPRVTGRLHLRLAAEPSIGVFTQSLRVVRVAPRTWEHLSGRSCDALLEGPSGVPMCVNGQWLEFAGQSVPMNGVAPTESMVWVAGNDLSGWRVDGGQAVKAVSIPTEPVWAMAAQGHRLCTATANVLTLFEEDGGHATITLAPPDVLVQGVLFENDDTLIISRGTRLDRVPLAALGGTVTVPMSEGQPLFGALGGEGLWELAGVLRLHRFDGGIAETAGGDAPPFERLLLPDLVPLVSPGQSAGLVGVPVQAPDGGIALDIIEPPPDTSVTWLTSRWVFARGLSSRELWRAPRAP
ncbi:MAG: hypothetical protein JNM69_00505 [Archangium sp.]|nr:hypothetical protein [Archangium sp.]